jgi:IS5 family transposase
MLPVELYRRALAQKRNDHEKIYNLHEPHINCVAKGKEYKKYEFGTKASVVLTKTGGITVVSCLTPCSRKSPR